MVDTIADRLRTARDKLVSAEWYAEAAAVSAAIAALSASGVVVPREPTIRMEIAFGEAWFSKPRPIDDFSLRDAYAAMLAAAPKVSDADLSDNPDLWPNWVHGVAQAAYMKGLGAMIDTPKASEADNRDWSMQGPDHLSSDDDEADPAPSDDELPGMWSNADLRGGETDSAPSVAGIMSRLERKEAVSDAIEALDSLGEQAPSVAGEVVAWRHRTNSWPAGTWELTANSKMAIPEDWRTVEPLIRQADHARIVAKLQATNTRLAELMLRMKITQAAAEARADAMAGVLGEVATIFARDDTEYWTLGDEYSLNERIDALLSEAGK